MLLQRSCATRLGVGKFANDSAAAGGVCVTRPGLGKFDEPGASSLLRGFDIVMNINMPWLNKFALWVDGLSYSTQEGS